jgi:hypothetical protein
LAVEAAPRALHVPRRDLGPDPRGGDRLAVDLDHRLDPRLELGVGGEHLGSAARLGAEVEVLADRDPPRPELADQRVVDEFLGAAVGELLVEADHDHLLDPEPLEHVALDLK